MHNSNLVLVRGGVASGKAFHAKQLADVEGRFALDVDYLTTFYSGQSHKSPAQLVYPELQADDHVGAVRKLLQAGVKVVVSATFATKDSIAQFAALSPDTVVLEMFAGARPADWEAYPDATPVFH
jgi:predicted kinase